MQRRSLLSYTGMIAFGATLAEPPAAATSGPAQFRRVRPSDPAWPSAATWETLNQSAGGNLFKVQPLLASCVNPNSAECQNVFEAVKNPYYVAISLPGRRPPAGWMPGCRHQASTLSPQGPPKTWSPQ